MRASFFSGYHAVEVNQRSSILMGWGIRSCGMLCCLFSLWVLLLSAVSTEAALGVVYGADGNNLPLPSQVVQLLQSNGVTQVRIYDTNPTILNAFSNSDIEIIVGVTNDELATIGKSNTSAASWVTSNIVPYIQTVNITAIAVGSEVLTSSDESLSSILVQGMRNVHNSLIANGLDTQIRVSTPCSTDVLWITYPPSRGEFNKTYLSVIQPMLSFLSLTGSFFMLNAYPYYAYQANSGAIDLDYALFMPATPVTDSYTNNKYSSLFDALVDATYSAIGALNITNLNIVVTETGWPHAGDANEIGPSITNAQTYNSNLAKRVYNKTGTPLKPNVPINAYVYELFNENLRDGPTSERNWGLFNADGTSVYAVDLTGSGRAVIANNTYQTWCVAKQGVSDSGLQQALDYACGQGGANCSAINPGGSCYIPNTLASHASYAFNSYYQKNNDAVGTCDFKGVGQVTATNPSYGTCVYQASNLTTTGTGGSSSYNSTGSSSLTIPFETATAPTLLLLVTLWSLSCYLPS